MPRYVKVTETEVVDVETIEKAVLSADKKSLAIQVKGQPEPKEVKGNTALEIWNVLPDDVKTETQPA